MQFFEKHIESWKPFQAIYGLGIIIVGLLSMETKVNKVIVIDALPLKMQQI